MKKKLLLILSITALTPTITVSSDKSSSNQGLMSRVESDVKNAFKDAKGEVESFWTEVENDTKALAKRIRDLKSSHAVIQAHQTVSQDMKVAADDTKNAFDKAGKDVVNEYNKAAKDAAKITDNAHKKLSKMVDDINKEAVKILADVRDNQSKIKVATKKLKAQNKTKAKASSATTVPKVTATVSATKPKAKAKTTKSKKAKAQVKTQML